MQRSGQPNPVKQAPSPETVPETGSTPPARRVPKRPGWMRSNKRTAPPPPPPPVVTSTDADPGQDFTWRERATAWIRSQESHGILISAAIHAALLVLLAVIVLPNLNEPTRLVTTASVGEQVGEVAFEEIPDVSFESEPAEGEKDAVTPQQMLQNDLESATAMLAHDILRDTTLAEKAGGSPNQVVGGGGFRLLEPDNAVQEGSFSAWTKPEPRFGEETASGQAPKPFQNYHIVIQFELPEGRTTYNPSDLRGFVQGTDGYRKDILADAYIFTEAGKLVPIRRGRRMRVPDDRIVQILVRVPGAAALVKDTIQISSRLLDEQQTLELVFAEGPQ